MALKREMFRLWLVCTIAWVTLIFAIGFSTSELSLTAPQPAADQFADLLGAEEQTGWVSWLKYPFAAIAPPVALLAAGAVAAWIYAGFRGRRT